MTMQRQMIVILGSSKLPSFTLKDSRTITMIVYRQIWVFGQNLPQTMGKPGESRMKIPSSTWELSIFRGQFPSLSREELIESISDWDMVNLFFMIEMMFMRVLASLGRNPLYFCFKVKANVYNSSFRREEQWPEKVGLLPKYTVVSVGLQQPPFP